MLLHKNIVGQNSCQTALYCLYIKERDIVTHIHIVMRCRMNGPNNAMLRCLFWKIASLSIILQIIYKNSGFWFWLILNVIFICAHNINCINRFRPSVPFSCWVQQTSLVSFFPNLPLLFLFKPKQGCTKPTIGAKPTLVINPYIRWKILISLYEEDLYKSQAINS